MSENVHFTKKMTPEQYEEYQKRRGKAISKALRKMGKKKLKERTKKANEARRNQFKDPKTREKALKQPLENLEKILSKRRGTKKKIIIEIPRKQTYAGVVTEEEN